MMQNNAALLMVYNAESGIIQALLHALHKQLKPDTYPCSLCALTYGSVSMRRQWRNYLDSLPIEAIFHHSDDFAEAYPGVDPALPAVMLREDGKQPEVLIGQPELDRMASLDELIECLQSQLAKVSLPVPVG